jgi:3-methyladenine DNA glycosylase AlkD
VPLVATTTTSSGSTTPAAISGASARIGVGHPVGRRDAGALPGQFGQPVRPRARVLAAVVPLVGRRVGQPVVGAQVDDLHVVRDRRREGARDAVRQRQEDQLGIGHRARGRLAQDEVGGRAQPGMHVAEALAGVLVCGGGHDVQVRMAGQQPQQLAAGVATRADHGNSGSHAEQLCTTSQLHTRPVRTSPPELRAIRTSIWSAGRGSGIPASVRPHTLPGMSADQVLVERIRDGLRAAAVPARAPQMQAYMKSTMPYLGVRVPEVRTIVRAAAKVRPPASTEALAATTTILWREAAHREERYAASALTDVPAARPLQTMALLPLYREMITTGAWWDHVDEVSHRIGALLVAYPTELAPTLRDWARDPDKWLRRSAVICQVGLKAATDPELLADVIRANRVDPDFFLRKGIGWALRDYARTDPDWVLAFADAHELSPLSRREALKHL